jgi:hypothetical protein
MPCYARCTCRPPTTVPSSKSKIGFACTPETWLKESIEGFSRFMFSRHDGIHFTTIDMLRTEIGNESRNRREICVNLADSGSAPRRLDQRVLYALNSAVAFLFEDTAVKAGLGRHVPLQDGMNDCLHCACGQCRESFATHPARWRFS